jgi:hypothetical protein
MTNTLWVHGNAAQVQLPTQLSNVAYTGPGLQFSITSDQAAWVHIPLPTLDTLDDAGLQLVAVHINQDETSVIVNEIAVYDGATQVHHETNVSYDGAFSVAISPHSVSSGVGVSLHFYFPRNLAASEPQTATVVLHAGGADYAPKAVLVTKPGGPGAPGFDIAANKKV